MVIREAVHLNKDMHIVKIFMILDMCMRTSHSYTHVNIDIFAWGLFTWLILYSGLVTTYGR